MRLAVCITLFLSPLVVFAADLVDQLMPTNTVAVMKIPNWDATSRVLSQSAWGQLWDDPSMRPFREKFLQHYRKDMLEPLEKELGVNLSKTWARFHGVVSVAFIEGRPDGNGQDRFRFLLLADLGNQANAMASDLSAIKATSNRVVRPVNIGEKTFRTLVFQPVEMERALDKILPRNEVPASDSAQAGPVPVEWTVGVNGSLLIVSDCVKEIEQVVLRQTTNAGPSLADMPLYTKTLDPNCAFSLWANVQGVLNSLSPDKAVAAQPGATNSISLARLFRDFGFGSLQTIHVAYKQDVDGAHVTCRIQSPQSSRSGIFKGLVFQARDCSPPSLIPGDVLKFTRIRFDMPGTWNALESTISSAMPEAGRIIRLVLTTAGKDQDINFDFRDKVLSKLGDDLISCERYPRNAARGNSFEPAPSLYLVGSPQADLVSTSLKSLTGLFPQEVVRYKEKGYLGRKLYTITMPRSMDGPETAGMASWTYTAGWNYVAISDEAGIIQELLQGDLGMKTMLKDLPGLESAAQKAGGMKTGYFSYENTRENTRVFFDAAHKESFNAAAISSAVSFGSKVGMGREGTVLSWFDYRLLPDFEKVARYFHFDVAAISTDEQGYTWHYFAPTPPGLSR